MLFLIKNTTIFEKAVKLVQNKKEGLTYNTTIIGDLVNKDTDRDGIPDWQESLYGLDPTKKETTPGIPDSTTINKLRAEEKNSTDGQNEENLTQTEKFSRELFSTVASLSQSGTMDQEMADKLSSSLADKIKNSVQKKVFLISDMKIINNDSMQAFINYTDALSSLNKKYPTEHTVLDVLQKFIVDENNINASVLTELNPIIEQENKIIDGLVKISVPRPLSMLHLNVINVLQKSVEDVSNITFYESDTIIALEGISQYEKDTTLLESAVKNLSDAIEQKLNN